MTFFLRTTKRKHFDLIYNNGFGPMVFEFDPASVTGWRRVANKTSVIIYP